MRACNVRYSACEREFACLATVVLARFCYVII
jgi:hypothetical protein